MIQIDLHTHSTFSDGSLTPTELVHHAVARGVAVLALTDHDSLTGLEEASAAAQSQQLRFVTGTEISVTWHDRTLHIVGLKIDPANAALQNGLKLLHDSRHARAEAMAANLEKAGIKNSLAGAYACAEASSLSSPLISRTHFAHFLVEQGLAKNVRAVFKKYLVPGKPGYVTHQWAALADAVSWIKNSGGTAVLAHPGRYGFSGPKMQTLLAEFKACGGGAIEVVTGSHTPPQYQQFADLATKFGFLASSGSDYHGPGHSYMDMGKLPDPPLGCTPIWHDWEEVSAS